MDFQGMVNSPFDCILLDLDDTLYPGSTGIALAVKKNIDEFLMMKCGITAEKASSLRVKLFRTYGSSLAGLLALGYDVRPDEYHSYVHGRLPYGNIAADPQLAALLQSIPQRKILFTNSDQEHMRKALGRLGVDEGCFDAVVCFETMNPHLFRQVEGEDEMDVGCSGEHPVVMLKPSVDAIVAALRVAGSNPRRTLFLDDSERNIAAGKALGLCTALVGKRAKTKEADYVLESISSLQRVIPEIWGEESESIEKKGIVRAEMRAIMPATSIQA